MDKIKVLLVDDDPDFSNTSSEMLSLTQEFHVEISGSIKAAMSVLKNAEVGFDVAVIDMIMENDEEAGLKLIQWIEKLPILKKPASIVLTGYASIGNASKCMEAGAQSYIEKISATDLLEPSIRRASEFRKAMVREQTRIQRRQRKLEALRQSDENMLKASDPQAMLDIILQEAYNLELICFDCGFIRQFDELNKLKIQAQIGEYEGKIPEFEEEKLGITGECAQKKRTVIVHSPEEILGYKEVLDRTKDPEEIKFLKWIGSGVAVPLMMGGELIGILTVLKHERNFFTDEEHVGLLEDFASRASIALKNMQLHKAKDDFISFQAHNLKNRVQAIRAIAGGIMDPYVDVDYTEAFGDLDNEMKRMGNLADNILILDRIGKFKDVDLTVELVNLREFIEDTIRTLRYRADSQGIKIRAEFLEYIDCVSFDKRLVFDALLNLIENAIEHSKCSEVIVFVAREENYLRISVSDNGVGIEKDEQGKVFDPYYKAKRGETESYGVGIGLAFVKYIAEAHGGKAGLNPKILKGTEVYMTIEL